MIYCNFALYKRRPSATRQIGADVWLFYPLTVVVLRHIGFLKVENCKSVQFKEPLTKASISARGRVGSLTVGKYVRWVMSVARKRRLCWSGEASRADCVTDRRWMTLESWSRRLFGYISVVIDQVITRAESKTHTASHAYPVTWASSSYVINYVYQRRVDNRISS